MIKDPSYLEDQNELPDSVLSDGVDDTEQLGRRRPKRELRELTQLLKDAGDAPEGEVLYDPDSASLVRSKRDTKLAVLSLDPDPSVPGCDWCEMEKRHVLIRRPGADGGCMWIATSTRTSLARYAATGLELGHAEPGAKLRSTEQATAGSSDR